jgi:diadenosine tetraphosphate (Ap4A) HIT family hydrolase
MKQFTIIMEKGFIFLLFNNNLCNTIRISNVQKHSRASDSSVPEPTFYSLYANQLYIYEDYKLFKYMGCIFCKIVKGEIPSHKIQESKDFLAILDINPNTLGMTIVLTKKHYPSYIFQMNDQKYSEFLFFTRKVAKLLDKKLKVKRTAMIMEGMGINHAHIKLYPLHGFKKEFQETWYPKKVFFKKYRGYITTQIGPRMSNKKLEKLAKKLRK